MHVRVNHKGPAWPWEMIPIDSILQSPEDYQPLVVVDQREYDYLQGLSLMIGRELDIRFWGTIPIGTTMFFTYVFMPDVSQGE